MMKIINKMKKRKKTLIQIYQIKNKIKLKTKIIKSKKKKKFKKLIMMKYQKNN